MAETVTWYGASGKEYLYHIYPINFEFSEKQDGNYIFCEKLWNEWEPIYVGEGDLRERTKAHLNEGCVTGKGATHIHAHLNSNKDARKREESDILLNHSEVYEPNGCNKKIGG